MAASSGIEGVFQMNGHGLKTIAKSVVGELANRLGIGPFGCRDKVAILVYHRVVILTILAGATLNRAEVFTPEQQVVCLAAI